jgi:MFS family permease
MKTSKFTIKLAILFYSLVQIGAICISSILARIAEVFPQYSATTIQFLATCPSIMIVIMSLLSGKMAQYIPKKLLTLLSASMFVVTALGGFFFHDSIFVLFVWEIILGMAIGILATIGSSLITDHFKGEERSSIMGIQSAVISVGGVILSLLGGVLATIDWYFNYLAFLLIIPGFILLVFGLPWDKPVRTLDKMGNKISVTPKVVALYGTVAFLFMLFYNVISTNLSMHLKENNITGSVNAGVASALLMLSGAVAGILFKLFARFMGERVIAFGFFNLALGALITGLSDSYWMVLVGVFIAGFSLSIVMAQVVISIADKEKPAAVTMSIAMNIAINNLGAFLSPNFTKISRVVMGNEQVASRYLLVSIVAFVATAVWFVVFAKKHT